jgi:hypothetical protein
LVYKRRDRHHRRRNSAYVKSRCYFIDCGPSNLAVAHSQIRLARGLAVVHSASLGGSPSPRLCARKLTLMIFESVIKTFDSITKIFDTIAMTFESSVKIFDAAITKIFDAADDMVFDAAVDMVFDSADMVFDAADDMVFDAAADMVFDVAADMIFEFAIKIFEKFDPAS